MLHTDIHKSEKDEIVEPVSNKKKILIQAICVDQGVDAVTFLRGLEKKLIKKHPDADFEHKLHFYGGEVFVNKLKKTIKKTAVNARKMERYNEGQQNIERLRRDYLEKEDFEGLNKELSTKPVVVKGNQTLAGYSEILLKAMKSSSFDFKKKSYKDAQVRALESLDIKEPGDNFPYADLSMIPLHKEELKKEIEKYDHVILVYISQTTSCSLYSKTTYFSEAKEASPKERKQQLEEESNLFNDFKMGIEWLKFDEEEKTSTQIEPTNSTEKKPTITRIVLLENIPDVADKQIAKNIKAILSEYNLQIFDYMAHAKEVTSEDRNRYVIIGLGGNDNEILPHDYINGKTFFENALGHRDCPPEKYLYLRPEHREKFPKKAEKYKGLKQETMLIAGLEKALSLKPTSKKGLFCQNPEEFSALVRLYLSMMYKEKSNDYYFIMAPAMSRVHFPKVGAKGKEKVKRDKDVLDHGLQININFETSRLSCSFSKRSARGNDHTNTVIPIHPLEFSHSKFPIRTVTSSNHLKFWNLQGYAPHPGELAKMRGMSDLYTEKLISLKNGIGFKKQQTMLAHDLSKAVFGRLLLSLIEKRVFNMDPPMSDMASQQKLSEKERFNALKEELLHDLKAGINLDEYQLIKSKLILRDKKYSVYLLATKAGEILNQDLIISPFSLAELQKYNLFDENGHLSYDKTNLRFKNIASQNDLPNPSDEGEKKVASENKKSKKRAQKQNSDESKRKRRAQKEEVEDQMEIETLSHGSKRPIEEVESIPLLRKMNVNSLLNDSSETADVIPGFFHRNSFLTEMSNSNAGKKQKPNSEEEVQDLTFSFTHANFK